MAIVAGVEAGARLQSVHDARRAQVLDAARVCFAQSGFRGASMQEICAEAKMSPGALYRYFPSKEAIIEAIAEDERCDAAAIVQLMRGTAPLIDRVVGCALGYFAFMREAGASSLMAEIGAESLRNTAIGQRFARIDNQVRETIREIFAEAVARGDIPPVDDMNATIGMMMASVDGIALRQISDPDLTPARIEPVLRRMLAGVLQIET
ncbi:TetR family transcriptional regulator [Kaistia algarum]|uniref:TetR/AcrR family transcriptional regulator n=1 Tax=Kaistia algarum TaxID=2083279 RepID=UPI000CE8553E|nr:TetR/AcrR family transcriptional regulator [Kaistia algarum]MCX5515075.1 TetR/AcrR family transcriptional regulator [Kaistia algarum]PPE79807.1 TetR family transcriptional regulator [Kaistia algarum]